MARNGRLHCRRISDKEFSLQWNLELKGNGVCSSPNYGPECGTFSDCCFHIVLGKYVQEYPKHNHFAFRIYFLAPSEVVKNCPKIAYNARLLSDTDDQLTSSKSETWLIIKERMKILEIDKLKFLDIINKSYNVVFDFKLFEENTSDEMESCAKHIDFSGNANDFLKNSTLALYNEVKEENNSVSNSVDDKASGQYNVEYPDDLIQDLRSLYNTGLMSDIEIRIGEQTLHAHKLILCARSPVFKKMMEHEFVESTSNCINISDCEPTVFQKFIKYLYSGEIEDKTTDTIIELYTLADKYDVKGLRISCSKILQSEFSSASIDHLADIVLNVLQLAECLSDSKLKDLAISFIIDHFPEVTSKQSWKEFLQSNSELTSEILALVATALRKTINLRS